MKSISLLYIIILISAFSCRAPVAYINSTPSSSLLEKKGDFIVKANTGPDFKFESPAFDFAMAWSPVNNWGIAAYQTKMRDQEKNNGSSTEISYTKFKNRGFSLINYQPINDEFLLEVAAGYGSGRVKGGESFDYYESDVFPVGAFKNRDQYAIDSKFNKIFIQSNINFQEINSGRERYTIGMRFQRIHFR